MTIETILNSDMSVAHITDCATSPVNCATSPVVCATSPVNCATSPVSAPPVLIKKIRRSAALFWYELRDVRILYSRALIQRTIDVSPAFLEHGSEEKMSTCKPWSKQAGGWIHFCMKRLRTWTLIKYSRSKIKNIKSIAVDVLFKAYPLSYRSNLARRYL